MSDKKALVVIDMQNDYLWSNRKKMFSYNTTELVNAVNNLIHKYSEQGNDVIYIGQVFPNIITNKWFIGFSIKGTAGAEIYPDVDIVSDYYFEKNLPDSFTARSFREFMAEKQYSEITVCGLDLCGCVGATAKGAVKTGARVRLAESAAGCRFKKEKADKMKSTLISLGVKII
ncbi:MAG: cysteine hydrolase [Oscillospiraceae bacterium]|nr:cysteine hydrolase [Oscillospiraceae bacterium]